MSHTNLILIHTFNLPFHRLIHTFLTLSHDTTFLNFSHQLRIWQFSWDGGSCGLHSSRFLWIFFCPFVAIIHLVVWCYCIYMLTRYDIIFEGLWMCSRVDIWSIWFDQQIGRYQWLIRKRFGLMVWINVHCSLTMIVIFSHRNFNVHKKIIKGLFVMCYTIRTQRGYGICSCSPVCSWFAWRPWPDDIHGYHRNSCFNGRFFLFSLLNYYVWTSFTKLHKFFMLMSTRRRLTILFFSPFSMTFSFFSL